MRGCVYLDVDVCIRICIHTYTHIYIHITHEFPLLYLKKKIVWPVCPQAVSKAAELGILERDPTEDLEGIEMARKLLVLGT